MGDGFTKLFSSIIGSSIWSEDNATRILWITMLAIADQDGFCNVSIPGLSAMSRLPVEDVVKGIEKLQAPDPFSKSADHDGRRVEKVDGGWIILNYTVYRDRQRQEHRREYMRSLMAEKRDSGLLAVPANKVLTGANKVLTGANSSASASASVSESGNREGCGEGKQPATHLQMAIEAVRMAHKAFEPLTDMQIASALHGWPEERWDAAIADMGRQYAGANMPVPIRTLEAYLRGVGVGGGKQARKPFVSELKVQLDLIQKEIEAADARGDKAKAGELRQKKRQIKDQIIGV